MKESKTSRITRLRAAKQKVQEQINTIEGSLTVQNKEHKVSRLNDQLTTITNRVNRLRGRKHIHPA